MSPLLFNPVALGACRGSNFEVTAETFRCGFELRVVERGAGEEATWSTFALANRSLPLNPVAIISSSDLKRAKAVTKNSWYVLGDGHNTSALLLTIRAGAVDRVRTAIDQVVDRGDEVAMLLDGEIVGVLGFHHSLDGGRIAIDASFFSDGTEKEKECETRRLADQINSTLY